MALTVNALLKDKTVLYIVLFFAVTNVIGYLMIHNIEAILFFAIVGVLTAHFTKNMIIVLLTALVATNAVVGARRAVQSREGFEHSSDDDKRKNKKEGLSLGGLGGDDKKKHKHKHKHKHKGHDDDSGSDSDSDSDSDDKKESMATKRDGPVAASATQDEEESGRKPRLDHAATLESAYDNLDKLLGSSAMAAMGKDTKNLADKQANLMNNIQKLEPMIQKAGSMLEGLEASGGVIEGLMQKVGGLAGGLGGKLGSKGDK